MSKKWKRPTKAEIARIRSECQERGISEKRTEAILTDARRSPEEAERHEQEVLAKWTAEDASRPTQTPEELRAWHDEVSGRRPPRKLPTECAVFCPEWIHD